MRKLTGCYCDLCLSEQYSNFLTLTPLQELQPDDLIGYLSSVDILLKESRDFKYFLPRLLELEIQTDDFSNFFYDLVWTVLGRTDHEIWPILEKNALKAFAQAYLDKARRHQNSEMAHLDLVEARLDRFDFP
jgi:hypothetical protein